MNKFLLLAVLVATTALSVLRCSADRIGPKPGELVTVDGFQLSMTAGASEYEMSTPITIDTFITNVTDKSLILGMSSNLATYRFEVKTAEGEIIPPTRYGKNIERNKGTNFAKGPLEVAPGRNYSQAFILNQMFDMTLSGEYIVRVSYHILTPENRDTEATSNTLRIHVK